MRCGAQRRTSSGQDGEGGLQQPRRLEAPQAGAARAVGETVRGVGYRLVEILD